MKLKTALIIPVIILLSILAITIFSYSELQTVLINNLGIESHTKNLILLDDLKTYADNIWHEIIEIENNDSQSSESLTEHFSSIDSDKSKILQITESNLDLDSNFLQKFSESSDSIFSKIDVLKQSSNSQNSTEMSNLLSEIILELESLILLTESEYNSEKTTFLLLHEVYLEKHSYANFLVLIVIVTSIFLMISISFWIYKTHRLTQQDAQKSEFASMITHELKTPLAPILNACELLKDEILGKLNESQKEEVVRIERNADSLLKIIIDILDAQKLDVGKLVFSNSQFKVSTLFDELKSDNTPLFDEKNIKFEFQIQDNIMIDSDKNRIRQVFNNLIKNSLDFVKSDSGVIKIGCESKKSHITFFVEDNGIGIPKDEQKNLFKSFYQIDTSLKRKHGGTGLGLTVCKGIVEGLNGKIWIESEYGKGTKMFFTIPVNPI